MSTELTPIAVAAEELRASAEDMEQAAWRTGLTPDEPLGIWVISLRRTLTNLANLAEGEAQGVSAVIEGTRKLVDAEITQLRTANEGAVRAMNEANAALSRAKVEAEKLTLKTLGDLAPKILEHIRDAVVIRERRYNRKVEWRRATLVGMSVLGLMVGGYSWREWQDHDANAALGRCLEHQFQTPNGDKFCPVSSLHPK